MSDSEPPILPQTQPDHDGGPPRPPKITARAVEDGAPEGESILDEIQRRMRMRFPDARVERDSSSVAYIPDDHDCFMVRLTIKRGPLTRLRYVVHYGESSEEFNSTKRPVGICLWTFDVLPSSRVFVRWQTLSKDCRSLGRKANALAGRLGMRELEGRAPPNLDASRNPLFAEPSHRLRGG